MTDALADLTEYASTLIGLTADPSTPWRSQYLNLIAPGETPQRAADMADKMSGCALTMRGVLRRFIAHPLLTAPYVTGHAMSDLLAIGREAHALRPVSDTPTAGDIVIVAAPEHTWISIGEWGIDGGQVVDGHQAVTRRAHAVASGWDVTATYRRRVMAIVDTAAVVARFGR
jgi:hypothetical protein